MADAEVAFAGKPSFIDFSFGLGCRSKDTQCIRKSRDGEKERRRQQCRALIDRSVCMVGGLELTLNAVFFTKRAE